MIRRRHSVSLVRNGGEAEEDVNPNSYLTNLADCMLVVVVGLLIALVTHYGIDLQKSAEQQQSISGIEVNLDTDGDGLIDSKYTESGKVYKDPDTGQYYLVSN